MFAYEYVHTACGILPSEQMKVVVNIKRNGFECDVASGNTYSTTIKDRVLSSNRPLRPTTKRTTREEWFFLGSKVFAKGEDISSFTLPRKRAEVRKTDM